MNSARSCQGIVKIPASFLCLFAALDSCQVDRATNLSSMNYAAVRQVQTTSYNGSYIYVYIYVCICICSSYLYLHLHLHLHLQLASRFVLSKLWAIIVNLQCIYKLPSSCACTNKRKYAATVALRSSERMKGDYYILYII